MHVLLERQLRRALPDRLELDERCHAFFAAVSDAYAAFDDDRAMLERSLEISSQELLAANAEMRAIFEALPDSCFVLDQDGVIQEFRGAPMRHANFDAAEIRGRTIIEAIGKLSASLLPSVQSACRGEMTSSTEIARLTSEHVHTFEARVMPLVRGRALLILRDMTAQKRIDEALRQSERRFLSLVENASELIFIIDADGTLRFASPSVERVMGYRAEDWAGLNILSLIGPADLSRAVDALGAIVARAGIHPPVHLSVRQREGSWLELEISGNNLLHDPAVRGIVLNARVASDAGTTAHADGRTLAS